MSSLLNLITHHYGSPVSGGQLSDCAVYDTVSYLEQPCPSPAGQKTLAIDNGSRIVSCPAGSSVQTFVSISCDNSSSPTGYHYENSVSCISNTRSCNPIPDHATVATEIYNNSSSSWGSCNVITCDDNYTLSNNACSPTVVDNTINQNAKIRPSNLTIPKGFNPVEFFVSGFTQDTLSVSFVNLPGASLVSIDGQWNLGSYMYHVIINVDPAQVPSNGLNGKVRVGNVAQGYAETNLIVQASGIFGVGEMASSQSFLDNRRLILVYIQLFQFQVQVLQKDIALKSIKQIFMAPDKLWVYLVGMKLGQ